MSSATDLQIFRDRLDGRGRCSGTIVHSDDGPFANLTIRDGAGGSISLLTDDAEFLTAVSTEARLAAARLRKEQAVFAAAAKARQEIAEQMAAEDAEAERQADKAAWAEAATPPAADPADHLTVLATLPAEPRVSLPPVDAPLPF